MKLLYGADQHVGEWMAARLPMVQAVERIGRFVAIGVIDDDETLLGAMFYHRWNDIAGDVQLGLVVENPRCCRRDVICSLLAYPFVQLSCHRVTTYTPADNHRSLRFTEKIGFRVEGMLRRGFGSTDAVISGLLREEWQQGPYSPRTS